MTQTLEQAIELLQNLPPERQDELARLVLHEIAEDDRWQATTDKYADKLPKLVADILAANQRGECEPLDPDRL